MGVAAVRAAEHRVRHAAPDQQHGGGVPRTAHHGSVDMRDVLENVLYVGEYTEFLMETE